MPPSSSSGAFAQTALPAAGLRGLASDTAIYGISTIIQRFLTFLLTPFYTNYLAPEAMGEISYLYTIIAFANVAYSLGLEAACMRFFRVPQAEFAAATSHAEEKAHKDMHKQIEEEQLRREHNSAVFRYAFGMIGSVSGLCTLLVVLLSDSVVSLLGFHVVNGATIAAAALIALFDALTLIPYAVLRMERRATRFAVTKLAVVVLNVIGNVLLVAVLQRGVQGIILAGVVSSLAGVLFVSPELMRFARWQSASKASISQSQASISSELRRQMWNFGLPTLPAAFSSMILQVGDRPVMAWMLGAAAVGIYQTNYRLGIPMMLVVSVFEQAWKPFYLREAGSRQARAMFVDVLTYFTIVCCMVFLVVSLGIEYVVQMPFIGGRFINPQYLSGLTIVPVVLAGYYFNGVLTNLAAAAHIRKRTSTLPIATGLAAGVNLLLNVLLLPAMGIMGGAVATVGAYFVSAAYMCRVARKLYPLRYRWGKIATALISTAFTYKAALLMTDGMTVVPGLILRCCSVLVLLVVWFSVGMFKRSSSAKKV